MKTLAAILVLACASIAAADTIKLKNGGSLTGVVVKEADDKITLRLKYATVTVDKEEIASIQKSPAAAASGKAAPRLADWERCIEMIAKRDKDGRIQQVPALVIDNGIFKNVPYMSHRIDNYEFNLYGDPDAPCALEIGVYNELLKDDAAKKRCLEAMAELLGLPADQDILKSIDIVPVKKDRDGLTFEVTPPTAEDAYGGWWISVYDVKALEQARASQEELDRITETREEMERQDAEIKAKEKARRDEENKAKADARKEDAARRAEERAAAAAANQPPPSDLGYSYSNTNDDWVAPYYAWGRWRYPVRPALRPTPHPRYYSRGYSRAGGSYGRVGGGGRGGIRK